MSNILSDVTFSDLVNETSTTVDEDLKRLDTVYEKTDEIRVKLLQKILPVVDTLKITDELSVDDMTAKIMVIDTVSKLLNDRDKQINNRVNAKLKKKDSDTEASYSTSVVEFLKKRSNPEFKREFDNKIPRDVENIHEDALSHVEGLLKELEIPDTELRSDPYDLG